MMLSQFDTPHAVILGLPEAPSKKLETLKSLLIQRLQIEMPSLTSDDVEILLNEQGGCSGVAIVKCADNRTAEELITKADFIPLDSKIKLRVLSFHQFFQYSKESYKEPSTFSPTNFADQHPSWFLTNDILFDQFVYNQGGALVVASFDYIQGKIIEIPMGTSVPKTVTTSFGFTPDGSFLFTHHQNLLKFFVGESWVLFNEINFPGMKTFLFSPCGRYVLTKAKLSFDNEHKPNGAALIDIRYGDIIYKYYYVENECEFIFGFNSRLFLKRNGKLSVQLAFKGEKLKPNHFINEVDSFYPSLTCSFVVIFLSFNKNPRVSIYQIDEQPQQVYINTFKHSSNPSAIWHPKKDTVAIVLESDTKKQTSSTIIIYTASDKKLLKEEFIGKFVYCTWDTINLLLYLILFVGSGRRILVLDVSSTSIVKKNEFDTSVDKIIVSPAGNFAVCVELNGISFWDFQYGKMTEVQHELSANRNLMWDNSGAFVLFSAGRENASYFIYSFDGVQYCSGMLAKDSSLSWRPRVFDVKEEAIEEQRSKIPEYEQHIQNFGKIDEKLRAEKKAEDRMERLIKWDKWISKTKREQPEQLEVESQIIVIESILNNK